MAETTRTKDLATWMSPSIVHLLITTACLAIGLVAYGTVQRVPSSFLSSSCFIDAFIPFLPEAVIIYLSFLLFIPVSTMGLSWERFVLVLTSGLVATAAAFLVFITFPTAVHRPPGAILEGHWLASLYDRLHKVDTPANACPSLHVALSLIAAFGSSRSHPRFAVTVWIAAGSIALSTILTKQHTVVDVAAGAVLAVAAVSIVRRSLDRAFRSWPLRTMARYVNDKESVMSMRSWSVTTPEAAITQLAALDPHIQVR